MISISGVPCTGKTSLSAELSRRGFTCISLSDYIKDTMKIKDREIEVSVLESIHINVDFVESHMSHLLPDTSGVIILECDEGILRERMKERRYSKAKIEENLEAQRSETIFSESLDKLPRNRILIIDATSRTIDDLAYAAMEFNKGISVVR